MSYSGEVETDLPWAGVVFGMFISNVWYWCTDQVRPRHNILFLGSCTLDICQMAALTMVLFNHGQCAKIAGISAEF